MTAPLTFPTPHKPVTFRDGREGTYLGVCPVSGRHRISDKLNHNNGQGTVWLVGDDGRCRGDGAESYRDVIGGAA